MLLPAVPMHGRVCGMADHSMNVTEFSDQEIHAATVFPEAFPLVLRPPRDALEATPSP